MLILGLAALALLLLLAGAFSRTSVEGAKELLAWIAALAGLSLAGLLLLTGRPPLSIVGLALALPLARLYWLRHAAVPAPPSHRMSRREALQVLGLGEAASDADIHAAWLHLIRAVHPDGGGTNWLAARVNQARDTLLPDT